MNRARLRQGGEMQRAVATAGDCLAFHDLLSQPCSEESFGVGVIHARVRGFAGSGLCIRDERPRVRPDTWKRKPKPFE
jgi:hypothetical protein